MKVNVLILFDTSCGRSLFVSTTRLSFTTESGPFDWYNTDLQQINIKALKHRLQACFRESWADSLLNSTQGGTRGKLAFLFKIKPFFAREDYMTQNNRDTSRILFNFRAGNHRLSVERMRYLGLPRHMRLCRHIPCRKQYLTGDESHIFRCPKNRKRLLHIWYTLSIHPKVDSNSQNEIKLKRSFF